MSKADEKQPVKADVIPFTLSKPVEFEGKKHEVLELDLESLTAQDMSRIKQQWMAAGKFSPYPATDLDFCALVACRAAKLPTELVDKLSAKDYMQLCTEVTNFLQS